MGVYKGLNSYSKLYGIWHGMKQRCSNPNHPLYRLYGAIGIGVCEEWQDFQAFQSWALNNGYDENADHRRKCSIDRIDPNGNYEPNNCRWTDSKTQLNNTKRNTKVTYQGETHTLAEWAEIKGINYSTFCNRWVRGWSIEKMLEAPTRIYKVVI